MDDMLSWYEASLPAGERKTRGHFSTPPLLVGRILDACGYRPENDLSHIRVLDPACGSGNFLLGAAQRFVTYGKRVALGGEELTTTVRDHLWGFDPDPIACFLAEMQLRTVLAEAHTPVSDSLFPPLHIHQADGLALPWDQAEVVDLFLANPPYLAAKNNDLSGYCSTKRQGQSDSYLLFLNLALQVVRPAGWIGLVLPDPVLARANAVQERQRLLAQTTVHHLWHLSGVFAASVGAVVIIAQKNLPPRTHHICWARAKWPDNEPVFPKTVPQALLRQQPGSELRYLLGDISESLVERLHRHSSSVGADLSCLPSPVGPDLSWAALIDQPAPGADESADAINRVPMDQGAPQADESAVPTINRGLHRVGVLFGETVLSCPASPVNQRTNRGTACFAPLGQLVEIRRGEELAKNSPLLAAQQVIAGEVGYPVLRGGVDVCPYGTPVGRCWIGRAGIRKPLERYLAPKLLVVKSTGCLQATLDLKGHVVLQTLYLLIPRAASDQQSMLDELYFLLALLNSRLLRDYVHVLYTAYKWVQPQIEQHVLAHLPIPLIDAPERAEIIKRAKLLMSACSRLSPVVELSESGEMYEEQERVICALYHAALQMCVGKGC